MKRRHVIGLILGNTVATAVASEAIEFERDTPVMQLFRQWVEVTPKLRAAGEADAPEFDALLARQSDLEDAMLRTPSVDARDFAAKVLAYCHEGQAYLPENMPELWADGRRVLGVTL